MSNVFNKRVNTTYIKSSYKICVTGCFIEECLFFTVSTFGNICMLTSNSWKLNFFNQLEMTTEH